MSWIVASGSHAVELSRMVSKILAGAAATLELDDDALVRPQPSRPANGARSPRGSRLWPR